PGQATRDEFRLPCLQLLTAVSVENWIRLTGAEGLNLETVHRGALMPLPDPRPTADESVFFTLQPRYQANFLLNQSASPSEARVLTLAEIRGRHLFFTALVDLQVHRGNLKAATIELRDWPMSEVRCEILEGAAQPRRQDGGMAWTLELRPEPGGRYRFSFTGS